MVVIEDQIRGSQANKTLCHDIVEQILRSVPVKSLLRFKTVCKTWFNLISDPRFANLTVCRDHNVSRIHLSGYKEVRGNEELPWYFSVPSIDSSCSDIQLVEIGNPFNAPLQSSNVAGSCNGVLFLIIKDDAFLWNPSTREHIQLPPTNAMRLLLYYSYGYRKIVGLGYNSVFDEYKAISLISKCVCNGRMGMSKLLIYSSRVGYWEETDQDVPYCFCRSYDSGITVNGCPHWSALDCDQVSSYSKKRRIMFFDTADDKFKRLSTPIRWCTDDYDNDNDPYLGVLGGCLCATGKNLIDYTTDVWVMNEYGVGDSWIKLVVIPLSVLRGFNIVPLGFMNHGDELVLEIDCDKIITYNLKTKQKKFVIGTISRAFFESIEYVTSLVSPSRFPTTEE